MTVRVLLPEVLVAFGAVATLLVPALAAPRARPGIRRWLGWAAALLVLVALGLELWLGAVVGAVFNGGVIQDRFALFAKAAVLLGLLVAVAAADWDAEALPGALPLAFLSALGAMTAASAATLPALWAGMALAVVAAAACLSRRLRGEISPAEETLVREGAARAVVTAGTLLLLAGLAFAYLMASTAPALAVIHGVLTGAAGVTLPLAIASLLAVGSMAALMILAPFRYGAAPAAATSRLGIGAAAGLGAAGAGIALLKLSAALAPAALGWGPGLAAVAGAVAVLAGLGLVATGQVRSAASLLGASQLAWVLAGVAAHDSAGIAAALFLLGAAVVALCAAPVLLGSLEASVILAEVGGLAGFARREPARAAALALAGLSLAGVPPLAGFFGQFAVATALAYNHLFWLAALLLGSGLLAVFGASRIVQGAFLEGSEEPGPRAARRGPAAYVPAWVGGGLVVLLLCAYGLFANPISGLASQGAQALGLR
jgi:NADH:ubiquinone oxidoreductase subunit 2 (subunit N)